MTCSASAVNWTARNTSLTMSVCVLCVLLSMPAIASEDRPLWYDASEATLVIGHAMDLAATQRCLGSGRCHEANIWLARFDSPTGFALAKMTVASLGLWATRKIPNKRLGAVINYGLGAAFISLGIRNERIGR